MTKIKLLKYIHYGQERFYPDCPLSKAICLIGKGKTITPGQIAILEDVGECKMQIKEVDERPTTTKGK